MDKTCGYCQIIFKTYDKRQRFCSMSCGKKNRYKDSVPLKGCENCGKEFRSKASKKQRFCSLACFHKFNTKDFVEMECKTCGKLFKLPPYNAKHRVNCSAECKYKSLAKENSERFKGRIYRKKREGYESSKFYYRERLLERCDEICSVCKRTDLRYDVHHIDGNRENNSLENLSLVCRGCHQRIHKIALKHSVTLKQSQDILTTIGEPPRLAYRSKEFQEKVEQLLLKQQQKS